MSMIKRYLSAALAISCLFLMVCLSSCTTMQQPGTSSISTPALTPIQARHQQLDSWMTLYDEQFQSVKATLTGNTATPEQRRIALNERAILVDLKPLLDNYQTLIDNNGVPTQDQIVAITELIDKLPSIIAGGH